MWKFSELQSTDKTNQPIYQKPREVGRFSIDNKRNFHHDRHQMACYSPPKQKLGSKNCPYFDLNHGYKTERHIEKDPSIKENLKPLLHWMAVNKERFTEKSHPQRLKLPQFLTWRGNLTKLLCTPFENRDDWMFCAQKFQSVIYINNLETELSLSNRQNMTEQQKLMTYWGHKFEKYLTKPFSNREMTYSQMKSCTVDTHEGYYSMLSSRIGNDINILLGGEVDCSKPVKVLNPPDCYIELKTSRIFSHYRQEQNFLRFKALKWWAQSFLAGVPQITCGFRNDDGYVQYLQDFNTLDLPGQARQVDGSWDANVCLTFLHNILIKIKEALDKVDDSNTACIIYRELKSKQVKFELVKNSSYCFLPEWYKKKMST